MAFSRRCRRAYIGCVRAILDGCLDPFPGQRKAVEHVRVSCSVGSRDEQQEERYYEGQRWVGKRLAEVARRIMSCEREEGSEVGVEKRLRPGFYGRGVAMMRSVSTPVELFADRIKGPRSGTADTRHLHAVKAAKKGQRRASETDVLPAPQAAPVAPTGVRPTPGQLAASVRRYAERIWFMESALYDDVVFSKTTVSFPSFFTTLAKFGGSLPGSLSVNP
jgi:hypothetical protein